jgi:hypothetical protein
MREVFYEPFGNIEERRKRECAQKIYSFEKQVILSTNENEIIDGVYDEFKLDNIQITEKFAIPKEKFIQLIIEFNGESSLLILRPTTYHQSYSFKSPILDDNKIVYELPFDSRATAEQIDGEANAVFDLIEKNIKELNADIDRYNKRIKELINGMVHCRTEEVIKKEEILKNVKIKLKTREDLPKTYLSPIKRKVFSPSVSKPASGPPETTLADETYEEILSIIDNMAQVMERSPSVFVKIPEEDLRIHFLVQLNGRFEGQAMGEVFNLEGKTDILIRHKGENIFIAECKYWHGEEEFLEAITQLLRYITWRDTKAAIILFNTNKDFSKVLEQIPTILKKHPNYVKPEQYVKPNSFRCVMKNKNDSDKQFILTIKLFDIPQQI